MDRIEIRVKLPADLVSQVGQIARDNEIAPDHWISGLLARELSRLKAARTPIETQESLVAPLRASLARDLAHAKGWDDLVRRLASKGYALRAAGGGLALHRHPDGKRLCRASKLGFSYSHLLRRFSATVSRP